MNAKLFMSAVGQIGDETIARYADVSKIPICDEAEKKAIRLKKLSGWLYAAAAVLVLGICIFAVIKAIGQPESGSTNLPDAEPTELPMEPDPYAMLYSNVITLPDDRDPFENGLDSWRQTYNALGVAYSAVKVTIIETKYYLNWINDETGRYLSRGSQVSKAAVSSIPDGMNGLALHVGDTVYVSDSVSMTIPDENIEELLKLMSEKTGRELSSYDELKTVESFCFELTYEDIVNHRFMPIVRTNTLPKREGEICCMLIRAIDGSADPALKDRYGALYYCMVSIPADANYTALHEKYGFEFDRDIERVAEELKALF